ncbi:hypothetical protein T439DRAFT_356695 [Meredithblackwellia eburnea MCA 4105]
MFFSTEILSRRRTGFGIFWLAATVGGKGGLGGGAVKKLSKKEVLECDLVQACQKLANPDEPLALRLSSNLLCGIARVYQQQYNIYQADVSLVHQSLKKAFSEINNNLLTNQGINIALTLDLPNPLDPSRFSVPAGAGPSAAGSGAITIPLDPALMVLGYDDRYILMEEWDVDTWTNYLLQRDDVEPEYDLPEGALILEAPPQNDERQGKGIPPTDLAAINLQNDDYLLYGSQEAQQKGRRATEDEVEDEEQENNIFGFGKGMGLDADHPGLLMGHSPELDAEIVAGAASQKTRTASKAGFRGGAGSGASRLGDFGEMGAGAASSSAEGQGMGGFDKFVFEDNFYNQDFGGGVDEPLQPGGETMEERVRREHAEGAAQRSGHGGVRESSVISLAEDKKRKSPDDEHDEDELAKDVRKIELKKTPPPRRKKIPRTVAFDKVITLSTDTVKAWKDTYLERMEEERAILNRAKVAKEGKKRALDIIFGVPDIYGGPLADMYRRVVVPTLTPFGEGKAVVDRKRRRTSPQDDGLEHHGRSAFDTGKGLGDLDAERDLAEFDFNQDFGGGEKLGERGDGFEMGGYEEFQWEIPEEVEQGRAGSQVALTDNQRHSLLPWNAGQATSDAGAGGFDQMGFASSAGGTNRISADTPTGAKRQSRAGSLVPSVLRSGTPLRAGSLGPDAEFVMEPLAGGDEIVLSTQEANAAAAVALERESINFLSYAKRQVNVETGLLHFTDIVPVASTNEVTAASAFSHLLTLATKFMIQLNQEEPYGEIEIRFV